MYQAKEDINNIIHMSGTVPEKAQSLEEFEKYIKREIKKAKDKIYAGYRQCPKCKKWYRNESWEHKDADVPYDICPLNDKIPCL